MRFPHHGLQVDLDDDWWKEAGMAGFSPISRAYRTDPRFSETGEPALEVAIADVAPAPRPVGIFRDSEDGIPARERVVRILRGFRLDEAIPPVRVVENKTDPFIDTNSPTELTASIAQWLQGSRTYQH